MSLRRTLLAATWLAGTLLATGIVYAAVNAVAGQVTEQLSPPISQAGVDQALKQQAQATPSTSPSQPAASPTPSATPTSPVPPPASTTPPGGSGPGPAPTSPAATTNTQTFSLIGGTASVTCSGSQITLNWATPKSGYQVETGTSNGGAQIEAKFRSDTHESRLEAWCAAGQVQSQVREE